MVINRRKLPHHRISTQVIKSDETPSVPLFKFQQLSGSEIMLHHHKIKGINEEEKNYKQLFHACIQKSKY